MRYRSVFALLKKLKQGTAKVRLRSYIVPKIRIRYGWVFFTENAEIRYCWSFILLKMLNEGIAEVSIYLQCYKVQLRYGWGFILFEKEK